MSFIAIEACNHPCMFILVLDYNIFDNLFSLRSSLNYIRVKLENRAYSM